MDFGTCFFSQEKKRSILVPAEEFVQLTGSVATISGAVEVINVADLNISVTFH